MKTAQAVDVRDGFDVEDEYRCHGEIGLSLGFIARRLKSG
jgi:hypothetical protein